MARSRYKESRTLVRRVCRLPGEDKAAYRSKVAELRSHFERFNADVAELCQWFMGLRKHYGDQNNRATFGCLGDFLLQPELKDVEVEEDEQDRWRLAVFDDVAGFRSITSLGDQAVPEPLREAMSAAAAELSALHARNRTAQQLFLRLRETQPAHRLVLLKSAAEWIVARYLRGLENALRSEALWEEERSHWESDNPRLTPKLRERFTSIFRQLKDDQRDGKPGLRKKNPRICGWERLADNIDNCCYGQMGHSPLCWKFVEFVKAQKQTDSRFNDKTFFASANDLAALCLKHNVRKASNALQSQHILDALYNTHDARKKEKSKAKPPPHGKNDRGAGRHERTGGNAKADFHRIFKANWNAYLKSMGLNDQTAIEQGRLPHCAKIGGEVYEKSKCTFNKHTELCLDYKRLLEAEFVHERNTLGELEKLYRQWRKDYLAGPKRPSFQYPSAAELPMPKIFGSDFHEIDFDRSVLRLRLDHMREGEWMEFGFVPWPHGYRPSRDDIRKVVTSVHVNFVGARVRAGFRFDVPQAPSRFASTQDQIDDLRSRTYPRAAQDQDFINAARSLLLDSFDGDIATDLRILAVDMGMGGAHAAVFHGRAHHADVPLAIHKINRIYDAIPDKLVKDARDRTLRGPVEYPHDPRNGDTDHRGLVKEHLGLHLKAIADGASEIAKHRQESESNEVIVLGDHDFRGIKRHITWMIRDWARHNASRIVDAAIQHGCHVIVFESLRGKRLPGYDQLGDESARKKAEGVLNAYGRVRRKVAEKAVERGMRVVTAPYHYSSQVCSKCGQRQTNRGLWRKNKEKRAFICEHKGCEARINSDANAARVIARVFWGDIILPARDEKVAQARNA